MIDDTNISNLFVLKLLPWQEGGYEYGRRQNRLATPIQLCF